MRNQRSMAVFCVLAALALLFSFDFAHAGDPIQFSTDKTKPAPANTPPANTDLFKDWKKSSTAPAASTLRSITPFITPGTPLDPKEEKRLKNARDEKRNWMLLEPGELQKRNEEEEGQFGGKAFSLQNIQGDDDGGNYLFYGVGQSRGEKQNNQRRAAPDEADDEPKKENRASLNVLGPRQPEQQGAHTVSELNLKGLIDPSQVNAADFNKNEASLFQFFKDNKLPSVDRDQQARRESFRDFINGPQPNAAPSGVSDPINFRTDLTQERLNPIMPSRPAFDLPAPARSQSPDAFSVRPPPAVGFNPVRPPGLPEIVNAAPRQPNTGPSLPSPYLTPPNETKAQRPTVMGGSLFNREGVRRGGL